LPKGKKKEVYGFEEKGAASGLRKKRKVKASAS